MVEVASRGALEVRLLSRSNGDRGIVRVFGWLLSTVLVMVSVVLSAVVSAPLADLIPMHEIVVRRRGRDEELLRGEVPVFRGRRLLKRMRSDAAALSEADFLQK